MEAWRRELYHHGIKGQRWGVKRGPPYPLERPKLSKRIDKAKQNSYNSAKVADIKNSKTVRVGKKYAKRVIDKIGSKLYGDLGDFTHPSGFNSPTPYSSKPKRKPVIRDPKTGFRMINESLSESLMNANPLRDNSDGDNNCTYCAVAGFLRTQGYDATAKSTGGKMQNMGGVLEDCFKGVKIYEGSAIKFAKSPEDAAQMLKKRFGNNAAGAVGIDWRGGRGGHVFSWVIQDGDVRFIDFQQGTSGVSVLAYWKGIDPNGNLTFARLDRDRNNNRLEIQLSNIDKYVGGR